MEEPVQPRDLAQRRHQQRQAKEYQSEEPRRQFGVVDRVCAGLAVIRIPQQERPRHQTVNQQNEFRKPDVFHLRTLSFQPFAASKKRVQIHARVETGNLLLRIR